MVSVSSTSVLYGSVAYIALYINLLVSAFICHRSAVINILYNISAEYTVLNSCRDTDEIDCDHEFVSVCRQLVIFNLIVISGYSAYIG